MSTSHRITASSISTDKRKEPVVRLGGNRRLWTPAVAATLLLTLGGVIIALLAIVPRFAGSEEKLLFQEGFENGIDAWTMGNNSTGEYRADIDTKVTQEGSASAYIASAIGEPTGSASLVREFNAEEYSGKRLRFSVYLKTESASWTQFSVQIYGQPIEVGGGRNVPRYATGVVPEQPTRTATDWQRYDLVLDVPQDATNIRVSLKAAGKGRIWMDNLQFSSVSLDVATTDIFGHRGTENLDFEDGLSRWFADSESPMSFDVSTDTAMSYTGNASVRLTGYNDVIDDGITQYLGQLLRSDEYKGQKVRLSATIKTEELSGIGEMLVIVSDRSMTLLGPVTRFHQSIGTADWQRYELVVDVPEDSTTITLGFSLSGKGKLWIDDVRLDVIGTADSATPDIRSTPTPSR